MITTFGIAISTLNDGIYNIDFRSEFNYLIVHQINNKIDYSKYIKNLPKNVKYIYSYDVGLSKSRNLAITNSPFDYLWIMDDDVKIRDKACEYIKSLIKTYPNYSMFVVSHSDKKIDYLSGKKIKKINFVSAMKVSSIDMIINLKVLKGNLFNEMFGLGARYPSGEEYIFTSNLLSSGLKVLKSRKVCSYHPIEASGTDFYSTNNKLRTKLEMFKVANGFVFGHLLYFVFILLKIKVIVKNKCLKNIFLSYVKN